MYTHLSMLNSPLRGRAANSESHKMEPAVLRKRCLCHPRAGGALTTQKEPHQLTVLIKAEHRQLAFSLCAYVCTATHQFHTALTCGRPPPYEHLPDRAHSGLMAQQGTSVLPPMILHITPSLLKSILKLELIGKESYIKPRQSKTPGKHYTSTT